VGGGADTAEPSISTPTKKKERASTEIKKPKVFRSTLKVPSPSEQLFLKVKNHGIVLLKDEKIPMVNPKERKVGEREEEKNRPPPTPLATKRPVLL